MKSKQNNRLITNDLQQGSINKFPTTIVRSVSFQKLRQGQSLLHKQNKNSQINNKNRNKISNQLYQKMINNKLGHHINNNLKKQQKNNNNHRNQSNQKNYKQRNNYLINHKNNNNIINSKQQQQLKQCTFKPTINPNNKTKRTLNQFINQQIIFQKVKQDKVQQIRQILKANLQKQNTFQPNLKSHSNNHINKNKHQQKVYQRLYNQSKQRQQKLNQAIQLQIQKSIKQSNQPKKIVSRNPSNGSININTQKYQTIKNVFDNKQGLSNRIQTDQQFQIKQNNNINQFKDNVNNPSQQITQYNNTNNSQTFLKTSRRNSKGKGVSVSLNNKKNTKIVQIAPQAVKKRNQQICINKIIKQIQSILSRLNINKPRINYLQMCDILYQMKFITDNCLNRQYKHQQQQQINENNNEKIYIYQIWQMLQGNITNSISLISLLKIIYSILGFHNTKLVSDVIEDKILAAQQKKWQNLILNQKDSKNIKYRFQSFYNNRLKQGDNIQNKDKQYDNFSFKPKISKNSIQLAQKYRMKVIDQSQKLLDQNLIQFQVPLNGKITHSDLLMLDQKRKDLRIKLLRQQMEIKKKIIQDQIMGKGIQKIKNNYKNQYQNSIPQTARINDQENRTYQSKSITKSKFEELYQRRSSQRRDKSQDQIQAQKWSQQLTFKPQINNKINLPENLIQIPDFDKAVFRMYEGRRIKSTNQDSHHSSCNQQQQQNLKQNKQNKNKPVLYLNVSMQGSQNVKVPVFQTDTLKTITQKVKIMMNINNQNCKNQQLEKILQQQIQPTLKHLKYKKLIQ